MKLASILQHSFGQVYLMKICPMTSSFHLPHNTTKCQRAGEGRIRGKKSRGGSVSEHRQHDMFGPEEVKQRRSEAEWERGRERDGGRPATSSLTVHWAARVSTLHPSSGSNSRTLGQTVPHTHLRYLLMASYFCHFPINPPASALHWLCFSKISSNFPTTAYTGWFGGSYAGHI